ncbi:MAG: hypothetical protein M3Q95_09730 [Bacteroidota bacterium]|nr:hypothetical protein [Bacteroidota bacterium]
MILRNSIYLVFFTCFFLVNGVFAQNTVTKNPSRTTLSRQAAELEIDSLQQVISMYVGKLDSLDAVLETERVAAADLREQIIKLDDYRKKLEGNVDSFKGENLKLNQSNRILIVFNSLVAVLLIISLVFFLRKIGRKKATIEPVSTPLNGRKTEQIKFTSFEDKLAQLERLGKLREKDLLSEDEFVVEKQRILGK